MEIQMPAFNPVALIGHQKGNQSTGLVNVLGQYLIERGCEVLVEKSTAEINSMGRFPVVDYEGIGARAQLAVVLGGDGSMLSAARHLAPHRVPLVGVNQGRLGFMTDIAQERMLEAMGELVEGRYSVEDRTMLAAEVLRGGETLLSTIALNDVVISKGPVGRLIEFLIHIDGEFVYDLRSDGLIVATPTGSTAYSLSSNGPILHPSLTGLVLVPICPHTLSNRPISVSDSSSIVLTIKHGMDSQLHFDGQPQFELREGDRVAIRRAEHTIRFVHPPGYSYFAMLREKLHWGEMY
jgi:NAD+ kinase